MLRTSGVAVEAVSYSKKRRVSYNVKQNFARKTLGKAKPISSEGKIL